jgi:hypothetical protein
MELNGGAPPWPEFVQLLHNCFGPPMTDTPLGELALLRQTGNVDEFYGKLMALSCRDHMLTEGQQIQLLTTGLGEPLRTDVALQRPTSLSNDVMFAHAYEQRLHHSASSTTTSARTSCRASSKQWPTTSALPAASAVASSAPPNKPATSRKFSPAKIAECCALVLCFKCDEKIVPGHREEFKRLFTIELLDGDDTDPMISIHALTDTLPFCQDDAGHCVRRPHHPHDFTRLRLNA